MKIAALLTPTPDWTAIESAARAADNAGIDAVGFWDHYHSGQPDWAYVCGWSALGAVAAMTERVKLLPMVLNNLHYETGVLAKESSVLALLSEGRLELGIGAGDWPGSFSPWGRPFPAVEERLERLVETVEALKLVWAGAPVSYPGRYVQLDGATSAPTPPAPPRIVVGVGGSRRTLRRVIDIADELNVYADPELVGEAQEAAAASTRPTSVSVFLSWEWDKWPADPELELDRWRSCGVDRACISLAGPNMVERVKRVGDWHAAG